MGERGERGRVKEVDEVGFVWVGVESLLLKTKDILLLPGTGGGWGMEVNGGLGMDEGNG